MPGLRHVAQDMIYHARRRGYATRELNGGLQINLVIAEGWHSLNISLPARQPSPQDVTIWSTMFEVPGTAERHDFENMVELTWPEAAS